MMRATLALLCLCTPAMAQQQCLPRELMLAALAINHGEARQFIGLTATGLVMEVFAAWGGTWTITVTRPDGTMCTLTSGDGFEPAVELPGVPG